MNQSDFRIPLVLLHGWGVNARIWQPLLPLLTDDFEIFNIDLPGYGNDRDYQGDYNLSEIINRVLEFAPPRAVWVGWSLGASVAMAAALRHPHRFLKLQLVAATPRFLRDSKGESDDWEFGLQSEPLQQLAELFFQDYQSGLKQFLLLQTSNRQLIRSLTTPLLDAARPTVATLRASLELLIATDLRKSTIEMNTKSQIVIGAGDRIVDPRASLWLAEQMPQAELVILDSQSRVKTRELKASEVASLAEPISKRRSSSTLGHLCFLENPVGFVDNLKKFAGVYAG